MKIVGVIFVIISAGSVGIRLAYAVRQRCTMIGQLIIALQLMKSELATHGTPLPETFGMIAAATSGSVAAYFSSAAKNMNSKHWLSPMDGLGMAENQLKELQPEDPVGQILHDLSSGLGKFNLENHLESIESALVRLNLIYHNAEQEKIARCRTYKTLGLCAGIALAIILI